VYVPSQQSEWSCIHMCDFATVEQDKAETKQNQNIINKLKKRNKY
jgi:hypothetical protein